MYSSHLELIDKLATWKMSSDNFTSGIQMLAPYNHHQHRMKIVPLWVHGQPMRIRPTEIDHQKAIKTDQSDPK